MQKRLSVFIIILTLVFFTGCANESSAQTKELSSADLTNLLKEKPQYFYLVDVRTEEEYVSGHVPGAVNIPLAVIADQPPADDHAATIVVYCQSGRRSASAQKILSEEGYKNVINFGSIEKWQGELIQGKSAE